MNSSRNGISNRLVNVARLLVGLFGSILLYGAITSHLDALPPFIPLEKRAAESGIVLVADVTGSDSRNLNQTIDSAEVHLQVLRVLKSPAGLSVPAALVLQFALYPESFEARMRTPPTEGRYFVFLNAVKYVEEGENRKTLTLFRLYDPNPFAFDQWNKNAEAKLIRFLKEETP